MERRILERLQKRLDVKEDIELKDDEANILTILHKDRKQKQYRIEKELEKKGLGIAHSTMTGKLEKLSKYGLVTSSRGESDGLTYYELTPLGLGALFAKGKINFVECLTYFQDNQKQYFETLLAIQPNFIKGLEKQPAWFPTQLTSDLWTIHYFVNMPELRTETVKWMLGLSKSYLPDGLDVRVQAYCANRIEVEGKAICLKEKKSCVVSSETICQCPILRKQLQDSLGKHA